MITTIYSPQWRWCEKCQLISLQEFDFEKKYVNNKLEKKELRWFCRNCGKWLEEVL